MRSIGGYRKEIMIIMYGFVIIMCITDVLCKVNNRNDAEANLIKNLKNPALNDIESEKISNPFYAEVSNNTDKELSNVKNKEIFKTLSIEVRNRCKKEIKEGEINVVYKGILDRVFTENTSIKEQKKLKREVLDVFDKLVENLVNLKKYFILNKLLFSMGNNVFDEALQCIKNNKNNNLVNSIFENAEIDLYFRIIWNLSSNTLNSLVAEMNEKSLSLFIETAVNRKIKNNENRESGVMLIEKLDKEQLAKIVKEIDVSILLNIVKNSVKNDPFLEKYINKIDDKTIEFFILKLEENMNPNYESIKLFLMYIEDNDALNSLLRALKNIKSLGKVGQEMKVSIIEKLIYEIDIEDNLQIKLLRELEEEAVKNMLRTLKEEDKMLKKLVKNVNIDVIITIINDPFEDGTEKMMDIIVSKLSYEQLKILFNRIVNSEGLEKRFVFNNMIKKITQPELLDNPLKIILSDANLLSTFSEEMNMNTLRILAYNLKNDPFNDLIEAMEEENLANLLSMIEDKMLLMLIDKISAKTFDKVIENLNITSLQAFIQARSNMPAKVVQLLEKISSETLEEVVCNMIENNVPNYLILCTLIEKIICNKKLLQQVLSIIIEKKECNNIFSNLSAETKKELVSLLDIDVLNRVLMVVDDSTLTDIVVSINSDNVKKLFNNELDVEILCKAVQIIDANMLNIVVDVIDYGMLQKMLEKNVERGILQDIVKKLRDENLKKEEKIMIKDKEGGAKLMNKLINTIDSKEVLEKVVNTLLQENLMVEVCKKIDNVVYTKLVLTLNSNLLSNIVMKYSKEDLTYVMIEVEPETLCILMDKLAEENKLLEEASALDKVINCIDISGYDKIINMEDSSSIVQQLLKKINQQQLTLIIKKLLDDSNNVNSLDTLLLLVDEDDLLLLNNITEALITQKEFSEAMLEVSMDAFKKIVYKADDALLARIIKSSNDELLQYLLQNIDKDNDVLLEKIIYVMESEVLNRIILALDKKKDRKIFIRLNTKLQHILIDKLDKNTVKYMMTE